MHPNPIRVAELKEALAGTPLGSDPSPQTTGEEGSFPGGNHSGGREKLRRGRLKTQLPPILQLFNMPREELEQNSALQSEASGALETGLCGSLLLELRKRRSMASQD